MSNETECTADPFWQSWNKLSDEEIDAYYQRIAETGLSSRFHNALACALVRCGLKLTIESIAAVSDQRLRAAGGIGKVGLTKIRERIPYQPPKPCPYCGGSGISNGGV